MEGLQVVGTKMIKMLGSPKLLEPQELLELTKGGLPATGGRLGY